MATQFLFMEGSEDGELGNSAFGSVEVVEMAGVVSPPCSSATLSTASLKKVAATAITEQRLYEKYEKGHREKIVSKYKSRKKLVKPQTISGQASSGMVKEDSKIGVENIGLDDSFSSAYDSVDEMSALGYGSSTDTSSSPCLRVNSKTTDFLIKNDKELAKNSPKTCMNSGSGARGLQQSSTSSGCRIKEELRDISFEEEPRRRNLFAFMSTVSSEATVHVDEANQQEDNAWEFVFAEGCSSADSPASEMCSAGMESSSQQSSDDIDPEVKTQILESLNCHIPIPKIGSALQDGNCQWIQDGDIWKLKTTAGMSVEEEPMQVESNIPVEAEYQLDEPMGKRVLQPSRSPNVNKSPSLGSDSSVRSFSPTSGGRGRGQLSSSGTAPCFPTRAKGRVASPSVHSSPASNSSTGTSCSPRVAGRGRGMLPAAHHRSQVSSRGDASSMEIVQFDDVTAGSFERLRSTPSPRVPTAEPPVTGLAEIDPFYKLPMMAEGGEMLPGLPTAKQLGLTSQLEADWSGVVSASEQRQENTEDMDVLSLYDYDTFLDNEDDDGATSLSERTVSYRYQSPLNSRDQSHSGMDDGLSISVTVQRENRTSSPGVDHKPCSDVRVVEKIKSEEGNVRVSVSPRTKSSSSQLQKTVNSAQGHKSDGIEGRKSASNVQTVKRSASTSQAQDSVNSSKAQTAGDSVQEYESNTAEGLNQCESIKTVKNDRSPNRTPSNVQKQKSPMSTPATQSKQTSGTLQSEKATFRVPSGKPLGRMPAQKPSHKHSESDSDGQKPAAFAKPVVFSKGQQIPQRQDWERAGRVGGSSAGMGRPTEPKKATSSMRRIQQSMQDSKKELEIELLHHLERRDTLLATETVGKIHQLGETLKVDRGLVLNLIHLFICEGAVPQLMRVFTFVCNQGLFNDEVCNAYIRLGCSQSTKYDRQLKNIFQYLRRFSIQPAGDCLVTLLSVYSDHVEDPKMFWHMLTYFDTLPGFQIPMPVLERAITHLLKHKDRDALVKFNQWVLTSQPEPLCKLELPTIGKMATSLQPASLQRLQKVLSESQKAVEVSEGDNKLPEELETVLTMPQNFSDGDLKFYSHCIQECGVHKDVLRLAQTFFEFCQRSGANRPLLEDYAKVLLQQPGLAAAVDTFLRHLYKLCHEEEPPATVDTLALAHLAAMILQQTSVAQPAAITVAMLDAVECCPLVVWRQLMQCGDMGGRMFTACLQNQQPLKAVGVLKGVQLKKDVAKWTGLVSNLLQQLVAARQISAAFSVLRMVACNKLMDISGLSMQLMWHALNVGNVRVALDLLDLHQHHQTMPPAPTPSAAPPPLQTFPSPLLRAVLVACWQGGHVERAQLLFEMLKRRQVYNSQPLGSHPFVVPFSTMLTPVEVRLCLADRLKELYHQLVNKVKAGGSLSLLDRGLAVQVVPEHLPQLLALPFLALAPRSLHQASLVVLDALGELKPPLQASFNPTVKLVVVDPVSLVIHLKHQDSAGMKQGLHWEDEASFLPPVLAEPTAPASQQSHTIRLQPPKTSFTEQVPRESAVPAHGFSKWEARSSVKDVSASSSAHNWASSNVAEVQRMSAISKPTSSSFMQAPPPVFQRKSAPMEKQGVSPPQTRQQSLNTLGRQLSTPKSVPSSIHHHPQQRPLKTFDRQLSAPESDPSSFLNRPGEHSPNTLSRRLSVPHCPYQPAIREMQPPPGLAEPKQHRPPLLPTPKTREPSMSEEKTGSSSFNPTQPLPPGIQLQVVFKPDTRKRPPAVPPVFKEPAPKKERTAIDQQKKFRELYQRPWKQHQQGRNGAAQRQFSSGGIEQQKVAEFSSPQRQGRGSGGQPSPRWAPVGGERRGVTPWLEQSHSHTQTWSSERPLEQLREDPFPPQRQRGPHAQTLSSERPHQGPALSHRQKGPHTQTWTSEHTHEHSTSSQKQNGPLGQSWWNHDKSARTPPTQHEMQARRPPAKMWSNSDQGLPRPHQQTQRHQQIRTASQQLMPEQSWHSDQDDAHWDDRRPTWQPQGSNKEKIPFNKHFTRNPGNEQTQFSKSQDTLVGQQDSDPLRWQRPPNPHMFREPEPKGLGQPLEMQRQSFGNSRPGYFKGCHQGHGYAQRFGQQN